MTRCSCGTLNGTGALWVKVERDASESVIARIVAMVEEASETKAPTQLFIEKVEQRYSLGMVAATLAVFLVPLGFGDGLTSSLLRAMTFMIVASPCAVVLATMPPLLSAIANAGRHGVLVKSAVVMERLGQVDVVALDKTGTLTEGTPRVTDIVPLPSSGRPHSLTGSGLTEDDLLVLAAAAEHPSEHPWHAPSSAPRTNGAFSCRSPRTSPPPPGSGSRPPSTAARSRSAPRPGCWPTPPTRPLRPWWRVNWRTAAAPRFSSSSTAHRSACWALPTACARRQPPLSLLSPR